MQTLNISLFQWLAAGHSPNPALLWLAMWIANGSSWVCAAIAGWMAWRRPAQRRHILAAVAAAGVAALAAHALANAIALPRPFALGLSPNYIGHGARGSLPSAHASVMFAIALMFLARAALRGAGIALFAVALATGWARVYVGAHFPFDVGAGLLLGALIAAAFAGLAWFAARLMARPGSTIAPASPD